MSSTLAAAPMYLGRRLVSELQPHPFNPRGPVIEDESLQELADSIRAQGILQPLVVTGDGLVIAGHRRLAAARLAGLTEVPVTVREVGMADQVAAMIVENLQRDDLTPLQLARACRRLVDSGLMVKQVAVLIGKSDGWVYNLLNALKLPPSLLAEVETGALSMSQAIALERFVDKPDVLDRLARDCRRYGLSSMWIKGLDENGGAPDPKRYQPPASRNRQAQLPSVPIRPGDFGEPASAPVAGGERAAVVRYLHERAGAAPAAVALALKTAAREIDGGVHLQLRAG